MFTVSELTSQSIYAAPVIESPQIEAVNETKPKYQTSQS